MRRLTSLAIMPIVLGMSAAQASDVETPVAYEIAATAAVNALPVPLRDFFQIHLKSITRAAQTAMRTNYPGNAADHHIVLDVAGSNAEPSQRHAAARTFPRDQTKADALFHRLDYRGGGRLPWVIEEQVSRLVTAFRSGEPQAIADASGILLHFTTDAALPFNTTNDAHVDTHGHISWRASAAQSEETDKHRTPQLRLQVELIERLQARLAFEVRVSPTRYDPRRRPVDQVFDLLVVSHGRLSVLLRADAQATKELSIVDAETFTAKQAEYYDHLSRKVAPLIESSLEAAGLLTANLIGHTWHQAGAPPLVSDRGPNSIDTKESTTVKSDVRFIGSSSSTVVHRPTCQHGKRIKAENRVFFDSIDEARRAGRVGCKTCRPMEK